MQTPALALSANGTNHAANMATYTADGWAVALCRSNIVVSVEHDNRGPIAADPMDLSCHRCIRKVA